MMPLAASMKKKTPAPRWGDESSRPRYELVVHITSQRQHQHAKLGVRGYGLQTDQIHSRAKGPDTEI